MDNQWQMVNGQRTIKFMVFYRKYRPQAIDDLDSKDVRETLTSILSKENPPHAFLLTGPKGLGKTSSARIIAKAINCQTPFKKRKDGIEPCGTCDACVSITSGTNMDVLEIDAASNRGIDEIRDLKEKIKLSPLSAKLKVYIIDEVHMLTTEAFNALLKTLEEPPSHAMFILCTTEPHKVPSTILSRCFHIAFKKATSEELVRSFGRIAKGEGITIDKDALSFIATISEGSFRDGAKALEELHFLSGRNPITKTLVEEKYKTSSLSKILKDMISSLIKKDVKSALSLVSQLTEQGIDMKFFIQKLVDELHGELLTIITTGKSVHKDIDALAIKSLIELLGRAHTDMKYAVLPQLPLELSIIEYTQTEPPKDVLADAISEVLEVDGKEVSVATLRKKAGNIRKITAMYGDSTAKAPKKPDTTEAHEHRVTLLHTANNEITKEWLMLFWKNLIAEMKAYNHTIAGVLRGCNIGEFDKNILIIETAYKFHKERLDDTKTKAELSRIAKLLTGKDVKVEVQLRRA